MKFWPRLLRAAMPWRAMTSRSGGSAVAPGSLSVLAQCLARRAAISAASRSAAIRLSGRATPFPAISNPVP